MFNRFTKSATAVVVAAEQEARSLGSPSIEAEHLLLAYASGPYSPPLDRDRLLAGLAADFEASLRAAGVAEETIASAPPARPSRKVGFAASSKSALERAYSVAKARGDRRIEARHVALGALTAERGTVPRALRAAGLEPEELRERF